MAELAEADDAPALETQPIPGFEIDALRGLMLDDAFDDDGEDDALRLDFGRGVLDTIPLPVDELERLLVLTGAKLSIDLRAEDAGPDAARARREQLVTLLSAQAEGQGPPRATPVPATPRTMRGVEILLGVPMEAFEPEAQAAGQERDHKRRRARWTLTAVLAAAALVPVIALGMRAGVLRGHPSAEAAEASVMPFVPGNNGRSRDVKDDGAPRARSIHAAQVNVDAPPIEAKEATFFAARSALLRLRAGVISCARETISVLPGTSPPVPSNLRLAKGEGYASTKADWGSPMWSCAGFELASPQRFQIQWQMVQENVEGLGIAWIDDDEDGVPDRALGFRATLIDRWQPEAGDIEPIDPTRAIVHAPR